MECLLGVKGKDFVVLASDTTAGRSIVSMKQDYDKMFPLSDHISMAVVGDQGDTVQFAEFIEKNVRLYKLRNEYGLSTEAAANFTRRNLATALRSRNPYQVNMLIAGWDKQSGPELYWMDYLAALVKVPYAAHGYGGFFSLSVMDHYYREDLSREDAVELMKKCVAEICQRFIVSMPTFKIRIIDAEGTHTLPDIVAADCKTA